MHYRPRILCDNRFMPLILTKRSSVLAIALIIAANSIFNCPVVFATQYVTVSGTITDQNGQVPKNAKIEILNETSGGHYLADSNGYFKSEVMPINTFISMTIQVTYLGTSVPRAIGMWTTQFKATIDKVVDFKIPSTIHVKARVTDAIGVPIPNSTISGGGTVNGIYWGPSADYWVMNQYYSSTSPTGDFEFDAYPLNSGGFTVQAGAISGPTGQIALTKDSNYQFCLPINLPSSNQTSRSCYDSKQLDVNQMYKDLATLQAQWSPYAASLQAQAIARESNASTSKKKPITISCVKGKVVKKVTGITPKCPSGYTKKK